MDDPTSNAPRDDQLLDLNFVPAWARQPPKDRPWRDEREEDEPKDARPAAGAPRGRAEEGETYGRRPPQRLRHDRHPRPTRPPEPLRIPHSGTRCPLRERAAAPSERIELDIAFLPERRSLGAVVHRIKATHRAYPLLQLAELFLSKPDFHLVRIEVVEPPPGGEGAPRPPPLHSCTVCGALHVQPDAALRHVVERHIDEFFEAREAGEEPPSGAFACVAQCPRTGRLIGPPNHHSFEEALAQAHAEAEPDTPLADYRARLVTSRDPALIDQWRQAYAHRKVYLRRDRPGDGPLGWTRMRQALESELATSRISATRRAMLDAAALRNVDDPFLRARLREAWSREQKFPLTMMNALRPALRHMGLHFFKPDAHQTFVTVVAPSPIAPDRAVPAIRDALHFLESHPGAGMDALLAGVLGPRINDEAARAEVSGHLRWLVEKGHVIEFFDGSLAVPRPRAEVSIADRGRPRGSVERPPRGSGRNPRESPPV